MKAGSCLHELLGTGCEAVPVLGPGNAVVNSRDHPISAARMGYRVSHAPEKVHLETGRASPACLGPPNLGWTDGVR